MIEFLRLFIAVELSQEVHDHLMQLILEMKKNNCPSAKWVNPVSIHLTIKFLGDTPRFKLPELQQTITAVSASCKSFQMSVIGTGAFPSRKSPRVLWAGLTAEAGLEQLYRSTESAMVKLGYKKEERTFSPHLTLARIPSPTESASMAALLDKFYNYRQSEFGLVRVRRVTLFQSILTAGGSIYTPLGRYQLSE